jgi:hypothetical protein
MTEMMNCLPEGARRYFNDLQNIRRAAEATKYQGRLTSLREDLAAKNQQGRSGLQEMEEWRYGEEMFDTLAMGYAQDALDTCRLYEVPITTRFCGCLEKAAENLLRLKYGHALQAQPKRHLFQELISTHQHKVMPQIRVMIEKARLEDVKERAAMGRKKEAPGNTYTQTITQHGGVLNASQTGNVSAQQLTVGELDNLRPALAEMRSLFEAQDQSLDTDEYVGLLARAERAAADKDESKMLGYLKQIPGKAWDIGKVVVPQVLLHYLNQHNLA